MLMRLPVVWELKFLERFHSEIPAMSVDDIL
jgi:hypothetical protein